LNSHESPGFRLTIIGAFAAMLTACGAGQEVREPNPHFPDSLVGSWVRVYPPASGADTLVLEPGGAASGPATTVADPLEHIARWRVGFLLGPTDLCLGDARTYVCSAYQLRGDTLALANGQHTVLMRAGAISPEALAADSADGNDRAHWGEVPPASRPPGSNGR
jgi:hypothetical protein